VIGAHSDTSGIAYATLEGTTTKTGGSKDSVVVSHTHTAATTVTQRPLVVGGGATLYASGQSPLASYQQTTLTVDTTVSTEGVSGTNQNLVPYYALAYIMKA
jgi:microcystin-dependent protein